MRACDSPSSDRFFCSPATTSPHLVLRSNRRLPHRRNITVVRLDRLRPSRLRVVRRASNNRMHVPRIVRRCSSVDRVASSLPLRVAGRADASTVKRSPATTRSRRPAIRVTTLAVSDARWIASRCCAVRTAFMHRRRHAATHVSPPGGTCSVSRIGVGCRPSWVGSRATSSPFARPPARSACACTSTASRCCASR